MPLQETSGAASYDAFGGGGAPVFNYIEDVFSTYLYTGNGTSNGQSQTITNGIDLSGKGGLVWIKARLPDSVRHSLTDTARGAGTSATNSKALATAPSGSAPENGVVGDPYDYLSAFNNNGFTVTRGTNVSGDQSTNTNASTYASWTFRKAPKFFDVVTYTGNGSNRTISHSLGSVPGCIIVKRVDASGSWQVYHRSLANTEYMVLNATDAKATGTTRWNSTTPTDTVFSLGTDTTVNANTGTYVAYLFAHDAGGFGASGTDNVISCGSFTTDGSGNATVTLGYEPQWLLFKRTNTTDAWYLIDNMRGFSVSPALNPYLNPNTSSAEATSSGLSPNATGFSISGFGTSSTFIYIAIRRGPMRTPTTGTSVFALGATGLGTAGGNLGILSADDLAINSQRAISGSSASSPKFVFIDRLRGVGQINTGLTTYALYSSTTAAETTVSSTSSSSTAAGTNGAFLYSIGGENSAISSVGQGDGGNVGYGVKRAPGFFDVVCGPYAQGALSHNLGVVPELIINKQRNGANSWYVWATPFSNQEYVLLETTAAKTNYSSTLWSTPTSTQAGIANVGGSGNGVMYLFATVAGVSKVFSYTGNGSSQTINCGFTGGARFVLIKRTDSTGDWYVWDSARGIVASNDPHLSLNTTAAEVTTDDSVDTDSTGFVVNQVAATNVNVTSATYIGLAVA